MKKSLITIFSTLSLILLSGNGLPLHADWSPPVQISTGPSSINPGATPLVIDSNSVALVGWLDGPFGVAQSIFSANLVPQSLVWSAPQEIYTNTNPVLIIAAPTMSHDLFDNETATFGLIDIVGGMISLNASRRPVDVITWAAPISQIINGFPQGSSVAIDNLGNIATLFAVTSTGTPPFDITLLDLLVDSSSWTTPVVVAQDNSTQPAVAIKSHAGIGTLAWKVITPTLQIQTERYNFFTAQASPMINVPLPAFTTDVLFIDSAVDSQGDAILIYLVQIGAGNALYSSTLLAGENSVWSNPVLISDPANTVVGASIASDAVGNTTILWGEEVMPNQQFVRVATLPLGGVPISVTDLTDRTSLNTTVDNSSKVVMDSFGNAAAILGITTAGIPLVQVSSKAVGQGWTTPETLSNSGSFPLIALSDQGTAVATWIDNVTNILMGSRNLFLFTLETPTNLIGTVIKNKFLTQTAYLLQLNWDPSLAPNIVSYELYKDGQLIATVSGEGPFAYTLPLGSKHIKGTYTLVAIASNGNRSTPIPIVIQKK